MSDSVQPHRRQPTRLLCPQDSLGKNTGAGYHFLLQTVPEFYPFIINQQSGKYNGSPSFVGCSNKLIKQRTTLLELPIFRLIRSTSNNQDLRLASEGGGGLSWRTEPLTCGIWYYLWVDSDKIEMNCRARGYQRPANDCFWNIAKGRIWGPNTFAPYHRPLALSLHLISVPRLLIQRGNQPWIFTERTWCWS